MLFTFRTSKEGGEKAIEAKEYAELNKKAAATGYVDLVDVEAFTGDEVVKEIIEAAHEVNVKVVASNHDFDRTPEKDEIVSRLRKMQDLGADIPKIAVMPTTKKMFLYCYLRQKRWHLICGQTDHHNVNGRNRRDQQTLRRSIRFSFDIWSSKKGICTRANGSE